MLCIVCVRDVKDKDILCKYALVNYRNPDAEPNYHSCLCIKCYDTQPLFPQGIN